MAKFFVEANAKVSATTREVSDDMVEILLDEDSADTLRDWAGERLQLEGFGPDYELTHEGAILESLMDKFFTD